MVVTRPHPSSSIDFPGRNAGENLQFYYRHHWIRIVTVFAKTLIATLVLAGAGFLLLPPLADRTSSSWHLILIGLLACFIIVQLHFIVKFYCHFLRLVIVTDQSVHRVRKTLLAYDDQEVVDLASLQDLHKSQRGIVQNILGYGTLILEAQQTVMRIHFTSHVARTHRWIMELRDEARRRAASSTYGDRWNLPS